MNHHLKNVKVHWTGEQSDSAFKLLQEVPRLNRLMVVISKSTTNTISGKEKLLRKYLPLRYQTRIPEALGFDQLAKLVGKHKLKNVGVQHVDRGQAHCRTEQERCGLQGLLLALARGSKLED
jgi:hypothetical protein